MLNRVVARLRMFPDIVPQAVQDTNALDNLHDSYAATDVDHPLSRLARSCALLDLSLGGGLYPDQVLFCGPRLVSMGLEESVTQVVASKAAPELGYPVMILVRGEGVLLRRDATDTELAMARSVGDVMLRVPDDAALTYIPAHECAALLNWDAERYRRAVNT